MLISMNIEIDVFREINNGFTAYAHVNTQSGMYKHAHSLVHTHY